MEGRRGEGCRGVGRQGWMDGERERGRKGRSEVGELSR